MQKTPNIRVLAVSSGGGHWVQLLRLIPSLSGTEVTFASVKGEYRAQVPGQRFYLVQDASRETKFRVVRVIFELLFIVMRVRPHVVISTGAAPGYVAIRIAKIFGARTIWIDSIANSEKLSLSGQMVEKYADMWLTQWPQVARPNGPHYIGAVA